jgi:hypothetical protein
MINIKYINDVPKNIKALSYLGEIMESRIKQLETRINNYEKEIYRLEDKKKFYKLTVEEETLLNFYKNDLPKTKEELKQLIIIEPQQPKKNNYIHFLIIGIIILTIVKRKK